MLTIAVVKTINALIIIINVTLLFSLGSLIKAFVKFVNAVCVINKRYYFSAQINYYNSKPICVLFLHYLTKLVCENNKSFCDIYKRNYCLH